MDKPGFFFGLIVLLIFCTAPAAIDLYLPSLPSMAIALKAGHFAIQMTLTVYVIMVGLSQLIYGPSADRFGRKPMLLIGFAIFLVASIGCFFSTNSAELLVARAFQGLGMGCSFTIASAILGDCYEGTALARMTAFSSLIYSLSPLLAPVLGGYLDHWFGWQTNFAFLAFMAFVFLILIFWIIPETHRQPNPHALEFRVIFKTYGNMLIHPVFLINTLLLTLTAGIVITFNVAGPFLLQNTFQVSVVHYGELLFVLGGAYMLATGINGMLVKWVSGDVLIWLGILFCVLFSLGLWVLGVLGCGSVTNVMTGSALTIFATGFVFPNCFGKALACFPDAFGSAGGLIGSFLLLGCALVSYAVAVLKMSSVMGLGLSFLVQAGLMLIINFGLWFFQKRYKTA